VPKKKKERLPTGGGKIPAENRDRPKPSGGGKERIGGKGWPRGKKKVPLPAQKGKKETKTLHQGKNERMTGPRSTTGRKKMRDFPTGTPPEQREGGSNV